MIHLGSLICYSCQMNFARNLFDESHRRPISGDCGHTICLSCSKIDPNGNCPICKKTDAFKNRTVNYTVESLIVEHRNNAFQTFRTWWDTLTTGVGICSGSKCEFKGTIRNCLTCQQEKNLKDLVLIIDVLCEPCADQQLADGTKSHKCNKTPVIDRMRHYQQIICTKCRGETRNPQICTECFHEEHNYINVDAFSLCADCVIDHHKGHKTRKALDDPDVRDNTFNIIHKLMRAKMSSLPETKCILRKLRMDLTWKDLNERARSHYDTDQGRVGLSGRLVEETIDSLQRQFDRIMSLREDCPCVKVWENVERLKIHDWNGSPPHFMAMCAEYLEDVEGCPYDWESNEGLRRELEEIIERDEVLTEPLDTIYVF